MVALQKITESVFDEVYGTFLADDDPHLSKVDWQRLFTLSPHQDEDHSGYALFDGDQAVGMLGMIFSKRTINGTVRRFCNLHSWYVDDAYRGHSLALMRPALRLSGHTLTDFSPTDRVCAISKKLGFKRLDSRLRILLPSWRLAGHADVALNEDPAIIATRLTDADAKLLEDHRHDAFGHLLVEEGDSYCYTIFNRVERHAMPYCHVHYISNQDLFARHAQPIRRCMIKTTRGRYVAFDARLSAGAKLRASVIVPFGSQQLFRPADVRPEEIDSLYSEVSLLGLTTFPNLSHTLRQWAQPLRNLWPGGETRSAILHGAKN